MRNDGRNTDELRPVSLIPDYVVYPEGSVLITVGNTRVLCNVTVEPGIPRWMQSQEHQTGWVTAEYAMLPRSTATRSPREAARGRQGGRTLEIQRLIGRALRAVVDMSQLGERTIWLDCDVLQADGGARTASITGAYVALHLALQTLVEQQRLLGVPLKDAVAAVSVGMLHTTPHLDLNYQEDSTSDVDMNVVMTGNGNLVEIQGTAEGEPFSQDHLLALLALARQGINQLFEAQKAVLNASGSKAEGEG